MQITDATTFRACEEFYVEAYNGPEMKAADLFVRRSPWFVLSP